MSKTLHIKLSHHNYPMYIGENLLENTTCFKPHVAQKQKVLIVTNTTVSPLYAAKLQVTLEKLEATVHIIDLPDGEGYKNWQSLDMIFTTLLENDFDRNSMIIALGGGVIGDMAGFVASSFMRGIKFIQVPTTLLAQVDSSIGGKTGINHALGKNMIGAFCQPQAVIADLSCLKTLPQRELRAGLAEILKHAFIHDVSFIHYLEENIEELLQLNMQVLSHTIYKSCQIKAYFVQKDEKEQNIRAYLNFGHTFGHAIEVAMGYGNWLHGEAVACGMVMAATLSHKLNMLSYKNLERIINLINKAQLPTTGPKISAQEYIKHMQKDKKNAGGNIQFILLNHLGQAVKTTAHLDIVNQVLHELGAN